MENAGLAHLRNAGRAQKPSNARLTQLNANRPQATAATDARVVIALAAPADDMTAPSVSDEKHSVGRCQLKDGEIFAAEKNQTMWRSGNMRLVLPAKTRNRAA
jgi:hypothetical protein